MNKYVLMLAAAGLIAAAPVYYAVSAQAEDAPAVDAEHAADAAVEAAPPTLPVTPEATTVIETQLKDGTHIIIDGPSVSVVAADGALSPAPDGTHELQDGTKVTTVGGKVVPAETPAAE